MAERDLLLGALVKEVLGPRGGAFEILADSENPLDEYITGVLAPRSLLPFGDESPLDAEVEGGDDPTADSSGDDAGPDVAPTEDLGPSLDPRMRPSSMGLSFAVTADGVPTFDLAATWARYSAEDNHAGWRRKPLGQIWRNVPAENGTLDVTVDGGVRLSIRTVPDRTLQRVVRISIYLVNDTDAGDERGAEVHLFQPQIRIRCTDGTALVPLDRSTRAHNPEDRRLAVLYRKRATFGRGHLCSATWGDLDPECSTPLASPTPAEAPFHHWIDGQALWGSEESILNSFSPAQVRSEYVPVVPVNAPNKSWPSEFGVSPELDPEILAELFEPSEMRSALQPMVDGFRSWLLNERATADNLQPEDTEVVRTQLELTRNAAERIQRGIDLVCDDADVRRAFCFANKAIALQSRWAKRGQENPVANHWYPFQLAFQLLALPGLVDREDPDRKICDLLWFPTGGGKTEAYLGLTAFVLALRRIKGTRGGSGAAGCGTAVLSRYTLRLLTIQQFRRAVALVTACELLRVKGPVDCRGWRPDGDSDRTADLWGTSRLSIGLWVGGSVTPGILGDLSYKDSDDKLQTIRGAFSLLRGKTGEGEPAQVLRCPCCDAPLALVGEGLPAGSRETLHLAFGEANPELPAEFAQKIGTDSLVVEDARLRRLPGDGYQVLSVTILTLNTVRPDELDNWTRETIRPKLGPSAFLVAARGSRPGYFIRWRDQGGKDKDYEFEVFCGNPECELAADIRWQETLPAGNWPSPDAFRQSDGTGDRCPIPVWTVDEQIYHRAPSVVVATVDKFARLAFEPKSAALFGNVTRQHPIGGWFRPNCTPATGRSLPKNPTADLGADTVVVDRLAPPELIIQDELHLIEGPLGSMVGLYETAIDQLASTVGETGVIRPKYVASTATIREAKEQVASLFLRDLAVFPSPGNTIDDSFFARTERLHPLDAAGAGRLYVGLCAPGRGAQTPLVRSWSRLLQHVSERRDLVPDEQLDGFWTLVGYFNAIRELAGTRTLCRQDIPQRLTVNQNPRELDTEELELSSRTSSDELSAKLDELGRSLPDVPVDIVLTTSMFGTGVDVPRLGLMFVAGQPKTTSSYIQATGRVGRTAGALVVTFLRASRPRDLNHYEYFAGYHDAIYRYVEPITVNTFAERARDHGIGPVAVALLRNASTFIGQTDSCPVELPWRVQERLSGGWYSEATLMAAHRGSKEVELLSEIFEMRAQSQPGLRRPAAGEVAQHLAAELDRWHHLAKLHPELLYFESTQVNPARFPVVLGDLAHTARKFDVAYENAPNSLREVEATITLRGRS